MHSKRILNYTMQWVNICIDNNVPAVYSLNTIKEQRTTKKREREDRITLTDFNDDEERGKKRFQIIRLLLLLQATTLHQSNLWKMPASVMTLPHSSRGSIHLIWLWFIKDENDLTPSPLETWGGKTEREEERPRGWIFIESSGRNTTHNETCSGE